MLAYFDDDLKLILNKTVTCWEEMKNKSVFITGGTGFFGIWLQMSFIFINRELNLNAKIVLLTRGKNKFLNKYPWIAEYPEISFLEGDITDFNFPEQPIDYIIHAATEASVKLNLEKPLLMFDTIVNGTKRVLEFARIKKVKSFLMTSSGAVYGKQPSTIENISENFTGAPLTTDHGAVYGEGKRMAEVLCTVYHKHFSLPVKIARCYAFIGPFLPLDAHFAAGNFMKNVLNGEDIIIAGDGTPFRSYLYAADLMVWLWTILFRGENNTPYNVGSDKSVTISQLAEIIAKSGDLKEANVIIKTRTSDAPPQRYVPNINKAKKDLNLGIYTNLELCISKTLYFNKLNLH